MKLCRFKDPQDRCCVGLMVDNETVLNLTAAGVGDLGALLEDGTLTARLQAFSRQPLPQFPLSAITLLAPVDRQEVWAAGVTYLRSKTARMEESDFSASAYDRVYEADRPELFFKSLPEKVVPTGAAVGIRGDARWNVPEPELALVISAGGRIVGYT